MRNPSKILLKNSVFNSAGWAAQVLLNLIAVPVIIENLGISMFGLYTIALTIVGYFSIVQGLNQAVLKCVAEFAEKGDRKSIAETVNTSVFMSLAIAAIGTSLIFTFSDQLSGSVFDIPAEMQGTATHVFKIVSFGFIPTTVTFALLAVPQGLRRYDLSNIVMVTGAVLNLIMVLLLVWGGYGIEEILVSHVVVGVISCGVLLMLSRRLLGGINVRPMFISYHFKRILAFSSFTIGSGVLGTFLHHFDRLVVAAVHGASGVAVYSIAQLPMTKLATMVFKMSEVAMPEMSRHASNQTPNELKRIYLKSAKYVFLLTVTVFVPLIMVSEDILLFWIGPGVSEEAWILMSLLGVSSLIRLQGGIAAMANLALGVPQVNTLFSGISVLVTVVLIYPMITWYGLKGIATLSILASLQTFAFVYLTNRRILGSQRAYMTKVLGGPAVIGLIQAVLLILLTRGQGTLPVILIAGGSILFSWVLSLLMNVVDTEERLYLVRLVKGIPGTFRDVNEAAGKKFLR